MYSPFQILNTPLGWVTSSTGLPGWGRRDTCVGWQITLCNHIWKISKRGPVALRIGVGDGGEHGGPFEENIFGNYYVKFRNFVNFRARIM